MNLRRGLIRLWVLGAAIWVAGIVTVAGGAAASARTLEEQWTWCGADLELAIRGCTAVIQSGQETPENLAVAFRNRGLQYINTYQYNQAIQDFDEAIRLRPQLPYVFGLRGLAYERKGQPDRATQDYDQAIRLNPDDAPVYGRRGTIYFDKGQYDRAIEDFGLEIRIDHNQVSYRDRGRAYYRNGQTDLAIQDFDEAIRIYPNFGDALCDRSEAYASRHQYDQAIQDFDQAIRYGYRCQQADAIGGFAGTGQQNPPLSWSDTNEIPLVKEGGTFKVPVLINGVLPLRFTVDSGAADVRIPADVVMTLMRTGTLRPEDFLGTQTYRLADGSTVPSKTFRIRSLKVGDKVIENVTGSMTNVEGSLLLGQSFLSRFRRVSFNYNRQVLELD